MDRSARRLQQFGVTVVASKLAELVRFGDRLAQIRTPVDGRKSQAEAFRSALGGVVVAVRVVAIA